MPMTNDPAYVDWSNRMVALPGSHMEYLGLNVLEASADHLRQEITKSHLAPDGAWAGEALDAAMSFAVTGLSLYTDDVTRPATLQYIAASRTTRYLRRSKAERVFITASVRYRSEARMIIEAVAEDNAGRELIRSETELMALRESADYASLSH